MPELPEVEIVRHSLNKKIIQKTIKKVIVRNRNLRIKIPLNFKKILENQKILHVGRFSKYLIIFLSGKNKLLIQNLLKFAEVWKTEGMQIIGGCCGLGPEHTNFLSRLK